MSGFGNWGAYALAWLSFALLHSWLASPRVQSRSYRHIGRYYRIGYNLLSVLHVGLVILHGQQLLNATPISTSSTLLTMAAGLQVCGVILLILALRQYSLSRFSGLAQLRSNDNIDITRPETLNTSGLNQWVRHPIYSAAFLLLWGRANSEFGFATALFASLYLIVGSMHEERKLVGLYGDQYKKYQTKVPRFIPIPRSRLQ